MTDFDFDPYSFAGVAWHLIDAILQASSLAAAATKEAKEASTVTEVTKASRAPSFAGQENTCEAGNAGLEGGNCSMWDGSMLSADTTNTFKEDEAGVVQGCCRSSVGFEPLVMGGEEGEEGEMGDWERETLVDHGQSRGFPETKCAANTFPHFHDFLGAVLTGEVKGVAGIAGAAVSMASRGSPPSSGFVAPLNPSTPSARRGAGGAGGAGTAWAGAAFQGGVGEAKLPGGGV